MSHVGLGAEREIVNNEYAGDSLWAGYSYHRYILWYYLILFYIKFFGPHAEVLIYLVLKPGIWAH